MTCSRLVDLQTRSTGIHGISSQLLANFAQEKLIVLLAVISTKRLRGSKACIAGSLHRISKDDFSVVKTELKTRITITYTIR